jgi:hypothetical protein
VNSRCHERQTCSLPAAISPACACAIALRSAASAESSGESNSGNQQLKVDGGYVKDEVILVVEARVSPSSVTIPPPAGQDLERCETMLCMSPATTGSMTFPHLPAAWRPASS